MRLNFLRKSQKVRSLLEHSCAIPISFKIVAIFNITSADFVLISADVLLKMITILKEMRIAQLCSKNERTLHSSIYQKCKGLRLFQGVRLLRIMDYSIVKNTFTNTCTRSVK